MDAKQLEEAIETFRPLMGDPSKSLPIATWERALGAIFAAAEAHLATLPKTKEIEIWRVEWCHLSLARGWKPYASHHLTRDEAGQQAASLRFREADTACVIVTGPHKQTVPA